jgi:serine/threonine-protein kinase
LGNATPTAATQILNGYGTSSATTVLPTTVPGTRAEANAAEAASRKRSPWTWPLVGLIALLVLVLTGTLIALFNEPVAVTPTPSTSSAAPVATVPSVAPTPETPSPAPTPTTAAVNRDEYIGMTGDEARQKLEVLGFVSTVVTGNAATNPDDVGRVSDVDPSGPVRLGETVTVTVYGPVTTPDAPSGPPTTNGLPVLSGGNVQVNWPAQSCPSGQTLSGYELSAEGNGASITSANPTGATVTTATVEAGTGPFTLKFRYFCGAVESDFSESITITPTT